MTDRLNKNNKTVEPRENGAVTDPKSKYDAGSYLSPETMEDLKAVSNAFEEDGLQVPEGLSADAIKEKIKAEPAPQPIGITAKKRRTWMRPLIGAAACAALAVALIPAMQAVLPHKPDTAEPLQMSADANGLYQFRSYDELDQEMHYLLPEQEDSDSGFHFHLNTREDMAENFASDDAALSDEIESNDAATGDAPAFAEGEAKTASGAAGSTAGDPQHSETYTQVEGIDEADIVKTDGRYIYYLSTIENQIIIAEAADGKARRVSAVGGSGDGSYISDIYIHGDQLVVIGSDQSSTNVRAGDDWTEATAVTVYDISDRTAPKEQTRYTQTGFLLSSRLVGDSVCLVTNDRVNRYVKNRSLPFVSYDGSEPEALAIRDISCFPEVSRAAYTVVGMLDLNSGKASKDSVKTKAVLSGSEDIYCSGANLYIAGSMNGGYDYIMANGSESWQERTQILKVSLTGGRVKYKASAAVEGTVNNQWSMDERNGYFRVATTSRYEGENVNNLFIFDRKMRQTGACVGFARDESIKAVRYIKDKAYVITYRQTDPLFIIDLSDPKNPVIEGHVKISGFSTLLVPADSDHLLGLGFGTENTEWGEATNGVKLALFDISDPSNPKVVDSKAFDGMSSQVQYDHRALLVGPAADADAGASGANSDGSGAAYYAIPYEIDPPMEDGGDDVESNYDDGGYIGEGVYYEAEELWPEEAAADDITYGILLFDAKAGKIHVLDRLKTSEPVNRCIYIDKYIYGICSDDSIEGFEVK